MSDEPETDNVVPFGADDDGRYVFEPGRYAKLWAALVATVGTEFGVDLSGAGELVIAPPASWEEAAIKAVVIGAMVFMLRNRE